MNEIKVVVLLSGGIDSPVASYLMAKRGADLTLLHMDNRPYSDDRSVEKVVSIANRLSEVLGKRVPLYMAEHGANQAEIAERCNRKYQCVLCKKLMLVSAERFAKNIGAEALVMGDSLGQVASQTLHNIKASSSGIEMPILRPLIGIDKLEIESFAKKIGTYEISISPALPCQAVPSRPVTMADPERMKEMVARLDIKNMVARTVGSASLISP